MRSVPANRAGSPGTDPSPRGGDRRRRARIAARLPYPRAIGVQVLDRAVAQQVDSASIAGSGQRRRHEWFRSLPLRPSRRNVQCRPNDVPAPRPAGGRHRRLPATVSLFLAKRLATFVATLVGTTVITFLALEILPGDPARVILGVEAPDSAVQALREQLGLNRPALERYLDWVSSLAVGSFGNSYTYSVPVDELLAARLEITVPLALLAMALSVAMAMALGVFAAARHNQRGDVAVMGVSQLGISVPNFWLALLLILLFAVHLRWFSAGGFPGWDAGVGPALKSLLLPAVALATVQGAILTRFTRSAVLETMREDYVRTARAKGLTRGQTLRRHVLRNAMIPIVTVMGLQFANLLAGTIVVENVFALPGVGRLILQAITNRDIVVVRDVVTLLAVMVVLINLAVDLLYAAIDPRLKSSDV